MPLVTAPKASASTSNTPSRTVSRQEVSIARPTASSARVDALKARFTQASTAQPVARRPAGSSARAEEMAKVTKFTTPALKQPQLTPSARAKASTLEAIAPPPSGLVKGSELILPDTSIEAAQPAAEAISPATVDPQFASLARQDRQLRKAQQAFKTEQAAWQQEKANYVHKDQLKADPFKALAEVGYDSNKLVELQIDQAAPKDPQQTLLDQIAELKAQLNGITDPEKGVLAQRDQQAYDQAIMQIRNDAKLVVESNPAYGTIKSEGQSEEVVSLITSVFEQEGEILDVEEACTLIEDKLKQRLDAQYQKLQRYEWLKAKHGQSSETAEATTAQQAQTTLKPKTTTLTNSGSATRPLSARDRAILAVQERMAAKGK